MSVLAFAASLGISVIFKLPTECQATKEYYYDGCWVSNRPKIVYVSPTLKGRYKTRIILHELGHAQGYEDEQKANSYAGVMMKKYKW